MSEADETKWTPGTCPKCGSKDLRRLGAKDEEFVIVPKRECRQCGTVFSPPASLLFVCATLPLGAGLVIAAVGVALFGQNLTETETIKFVSILGFAGVMMLVITARILWQRKPKLHKPRREPRDEGGGGDSRDAKPWGK
jgi:hypothetical protein